MKVDVTMLDALGAEEYAWEVKALDEGITRYRETRRNVDASNYSPEQAFIVEGMGSLIPALDKISERIQNSEAMPRLTKWAVPFLSVPTDKLALITLMVLFNEQGNSSDRRSHAALLNSVAKAVQLELQFMELKDQHNDLYKKLSRRVKVWSKRGILWARRKAEASNRLWSIEERMALGWVLVNAAIECTDLFTYERAWVKCHLTTMVVLDGPVKAAIERQHEDMEILSPFCHPMVVPPKDWVYTPGQPVETGGYLYMKTPLLKPGFASVSTEGGDLEFATRSINILQRTKWQVNTTVLNVARQMWIAGGNMAGLPKTEPDVPRPIRKEEENDEALVKVYRNYARQIFDENARQSSKRVAIQMVIDLSRKFAKYDAIYMPYNLDFRGRVYPLPSLLQPQGEDLSRGLLRFSEAKPLGEGGWRQFKIHLANCIGWDKMPFDSRVAMVEQHADEIVQWGTDPLEYRGWMGTDAPFQTLAASLEFAEALSGGDPLVYVSRIPCGVDGSCNGLQHLSALGRDQAGGRAVNLLPGDCPADIYTDVANAVIDMVERDCLVTGLKAELERSNTDEDVRRLVRGLPPIEYPVTMVVSPCHAWRGHVNRKTVKRAVMTTPYGLTTFGMRDQFRTDGHLKGLEGSAKMNGAYLANLVSEAIAQVVAKAVEIMAWLQQIASLAGKEGHALTWWTPTGMDVTQHYRVLRSKTLRTTIGRVYYKKQTPKLSVGKQMSGIAPNFVHSLDAAHMMLVTLNAEQNAIIALAMIHDSYATHACDVEKLQVITRDVFVDIHEQPILKGLHEEWCERTGMDLPPPPAQGDLDITQVRASGYFFH